MNAHLTRSRIKAAEHAGYHAALDYLSGKLVVPPLNPYAGMMNDETLAWREGFDGTLQTLRAAIQ